jgi:uncharacterized protein YjbI with pentapeptide repeats
MVEIFTVRFLNMEVAEFNSELRSLVPELFSSSEDGPDSDFQFIDLTKERKNLLIRVLSQFLDPADLNSQIDSNPGEVYDALNLAVKAAQMVLDEQPIFLQQATEFKVLAYKALKWQKQWKGLAELLTGGLILGSFLAVAGLLFSLLANFERAGVDYSSQTLTADKCGKLKTERTFRGNFALTSLTGCLLDGLELSYSSWAQSKADPGTSFRKAKAANADFSQATMPAVSFSGINLEFANLKLGNFQKADFSLSNLGLATLDGADFSGAKMMSIYLGRSSIAGTSFIGANLRGADFEGSSIIGSYFRGADLRGANFSLKSGKYDTIT